MKTERDLFETRISEKTVMRILGLIAELPNRRKTPNPTDISGQFDFWFDGGACQTNTGSQDFTLDDGTRVTVACPVPWLLVSIELSDGRLVTIEQKRQ